MHFHIYHLSERAVTIEFGYQINDELLTRITGFSELLYQAPFYGFETAVAAYTTLTVYYDPLKVMRLELPGKDSFKKVSAWLYNMKDMLEDKLLPDSEVFAIPVYYGGPLGPDMEEMAELHGLSVDDIISLHTSPVYKVHMIGFMPGFPYLGGMPDKLASPRKLKPRIRVPAGSVGIAGRQTGIYPLESPGGWQIIGQTPVKLFDVNRTSPSLLKVGDRLIFKSISMEEFESLTTNQYADQHH